MRGHTMPHHRIVLVFAFVIIVIGLVSSAAAPAQAAAPAIVVTVPTPVSPGGVISTHTPTFTWTRVTGATKYQFAVYNGTTLAYPMKTVLASGCGTNTTRCSKKPAVVLPSGAHKWKVRAYIGGTWRAFSALKSFSIPAKPVLIDAAHNNLYNIGVGYSTWSSLLAANGYAVTQTTAMVTPTLLAGKKVFVALVPQWLYSDSEKTALYNWVNGGGALLVIGELYTSNVPPPDWAVPTDDLSGKFGINFRHIPCGTDNFNFETIPAWPVLSPRNYSTFGGIMAGVGNTQPFCTGILTSTVASPIITLDDDAVPSVGIVAEGRKLGSGRIIVVGDSNFWSNPFTSSGLSGPGINSYSNKQFAVRVMNWLATGVAGTSAAFTDVDNAAMPLLSLDASFDPAAPAP